MAFLRAGFLLRRLACQSSHFRAGLVHSANGMPLNSLPGGGNPQTYGSQSEASMNCQNLRLCGYTFGYGRNHGSTWPLQSSKSGQVSGEAAAHLTSSGGWT